MELNEQQRNAVEHHEGPMLILAGAGSGKTFVLTHRIKCMIEEKCISPSSILAVTFTNRATNEMRERIHSTVQHEELDDLWVMTFHKFCLQLLKQHASELQEIFPFTSSFQIADEKRSKELFSVAFRKARINPMQYNEAAVYKSIIRLKTELFYLPFLHDDKDMQRLVNKKRIQHLFQKRLPVNQLKVLQVAFDAYQNILFQENRFDFEDVIFFMVYLFLKKPALLEQYQERFRYILIDEYQDTNYAQYILIKLLASKYQNITVVGDDFQTIYSFRGSVIDNILKFDRDYPKAEIIKLQYNYRSSPSILELANQVIQHNTTQTEKVLFPTKEEDEKIHYYEAINEVDEARYIAKQIFHSVRNHIPFSEHAVLVRTHQQVHAIEDIFLKSGIPYAVSERTSFLEQRESKQLLSLFRFLHDNEKEEEAIYFFEQALRWKSEKVKELILSLQNQDEVMTGDWNEEEEKWIYWIQTFHVFSKKLNFIEWFSMFVVECEWFNRIFFHKRTQETSHPFFELFYLALQMQKEYEDVSLGDFLEYVSFHSYAEHKHKHNSVRIMSIHEAKGMEFERVFLPGIEEGILPHKFATEEFELEEERRVFYVAATRAKKQLFLSHCKTRRYWNKTVSNPPSRFLQEFDSNLFHQRFPFIPSLHGTS